MATKLWMTAEELDAILLECFGRNAGANKKMAEELGKHEVSISRWRSGAQSIGKADAIAIRAVRDKLLSGRDEPQEDGEDAWL